MAKKSKDKIEEKALESTEVVSVIDGAIEEVKKEKKSKKDEKEEANDNALDLAIAQIEKQFGKGSIMTIKGYSDSDPVKHISSGSMALNVILGKGGFAFGRVVEIYGDSGAGKTSLTLDIIANAQKLNLTCAIVDKENALDPGYAEAIGVNLEKVLISQPNTGEEALSIVESLVNSGAVDIIVIDSVAALNGSADLEKDFIDNAKMASRAALLTRFFERNNAAIQKNNVLLLCINQLRDGLNPYGPKTITTGGHSLKHATSYRLELHPVEKILDSNGVVIGNKIRAKVTKNKLNSPFKEVHYDLIFGRGIDKVKDLVELAIEVGVIDKAGAGWMTYGEDKFQGMPGAREYLTPERFENLKGQVIALAMPDKGPEGKGK